MRTNNFPGATSSQREHCCRLLKLYVALTHCFHVDDPNASGGNLDSPLPHGNMFRVVAMVPMEFAHQALVIHIAQLLRAARACFVRDQPRAGGVVTLPKRAPDRSNCERKPLKSQARLDSSNHLSPHFHRTVDNPFYLWVTQTKADGLPYISSNRYFPRRYMQQLSRRKDRIQN